MTKRQLSALEEARRFVGGAMPERMILELAREHGRGTVAAATKATAANRNTVKDI